MKYCLAINNIDIVEVRADRVTLNETEQLSIHTRNSN